MDSEGLAIFRSVPPSHGLALTPDLEGLLIVSPIVIRPISSLTDDRPLLMGIFCIRRETYTVLGTDRAEERKRLKEENDLVEGSVAQYHPTMIMSFEHGGKGIFTVSLIIRSDSVNKSRSEPEPGLHID